MHHGIHIFDHDLEFVIECGRVATLAEIVRLHRRWKAMDLTADSVLAARSTLHGYPTQLPSAENISQQYFSAYMEYVEVR